MKSFLQTVVQSSEKAARLARVCRKEKDLFQLLVEEKTGEEKNTNFRHDFKTLADVLIQETVKYDLGHKYPQLQDHILGEESNHFTNTLGEGVYVKVCPTEEETAQLLSKVLDGHKSAGDLLAKQVHSSSPCPHGDHGLANIPDDLAVDVDDIGIWIDPIDSTNNYIKGKDHVVDDTDDHDMVTKNLPVVTVLIGVFSRKTGIPIAGVVNQPFAEYNATTEQWNGRVHWGCVLADRVYTSLSKPAPLLGNAKKRVVVSFLENPDLVEKLKTKFEVVNAQGAGYKILSVALAHVDLYVSRKSSTYKWDSCAGHALLKSLGGSCVEFFNPKCELNYNTPREEATGIDRWCNFYGIIAFRSPQDLEELLALMDPS